LRKKTTVARALADDVDSAAGRGVADEGEEETLGFEGGV
jgi:hypothetical protein